MIRSGRGIMEEGGPEHVSGFSDDADGKMLSGVLVLRMSPVPFYLSLQCPVPFV